MVIFGHVKQGRNLKNNLYVEGAANITEAH